MKRMLIVVLVLATLVSGCATAASSAVYPETRALPTMMAPSLMAGAPAQDYISESAGVTDAGGYGGGGAITDQTISSDIMPGQPRMVIQNADLSVVVPDPEIKLEAVTAMAIRLGGYVVSSNMYQTYTQSNELVPEGSITIRVPSSKMDSALAEIKADAVEVQSENRSGEDVTQTYVDLQSRLRNLEAAEQQLDLILDKAENTEDVLSVFNQLSYYREQIELVKGQMQYYGELTAYGTISVRLIAEKTIQPIEIGGWSPKGVVRDAIQALINFLQGFVNFLIWFILLVLPVLIVIFGPIALVIWLIVRAVRKRNRPQSRK